MHGGDAPVSALPRPISQQRTTYGAAGNRDDGLAKESLARRYSRQLSLKGAGQHNVLSACLFIGSLDACDRLITYTISSTQVFFFLRVGVPLHRAVGFQTVISSLVSLCAVFTGWLADMHLGHRKALLAFALPYLGAMVFLLVAAHPGVESMALYIVGSMVLLPMGSAGIRTCAPVFAANQISDSTAEGKIRVETYFIWIQAMYGLGTSFGIGFLSTHALQGDFGFCSAYVIAGGCMAAVTLFYVYGLVRYGYQEQPAQEVSGLGVFLSHLGTLARAGVWHAYVMLLGLLAVVTAIAVNVVGQVSGWAEVPLGFAIAALMIAGGIALLVACSYLEVAHFEGTHVHVDDSEDVVRLARVMRVQLVGTVAGHITNPVQYLWFQSQACQMDLRFAGSSAQMSGAFPMLGNSLVISAAAVLCVWLQSRSSGGGMPTNVRFCIGAGVGWAAMALAAVLEVARRATPLTGVVSLCAAEGVQMREMDAAWLVLPCALTGISQMNCSACLAYITYQYTPPLYRNFTSAFFWLMFSFLWSLVSLVNRSLREFTPDDLDTGHLEHVYVVFVGIGLLCTILFWGFSANLERIVAADDLRKEGLEPDDPAWTRLPSW